jgi:hypothetical protein
MQTGTAGNDRDYMPGDNVSAIVFFLAQGDGLQKPLEAAQQI